MSAIEVTPPFHLFLDSTGEPLEAGYIYVGTANTDPVNNAISVYWDVDLTIPASQPIRTINGYPSRSGTPANIYTNSNYSITVKDKNGVFVFSSALSSDSTTIDDASVVVKSVLVGGTTRTQHEKNADYISVKDFGAKGDAVWVGGATGFTKVTDDTAAFQAAFADSNGGVAVHIPAGNYWISAPIFTRGIQAIYGDGANYSHIVFAPSSDSACLNVTAGVDQTIVGNIKGLHFYGQDTLYAKTAMRLVDLSSWSIDDIYITGLAEARTAAVTGLTIDDVPAPYWGGGGADGVRSIGILTNGRELVSISNVRICADSPIVLGRNPNYDILLNEDVDHFHLFNMYLIPRGNYCIACEDGMGISNLTIDGFNAFVGGFGAFYINDTRPPTSGGNDIIPTRNVTISNFRTEQCSDYGHWAIYALFTQNPCQQFTVDNCVIGNYSKGIYISKPERVSLRNVTSAAQVDGLNITPVATTVVTMENCIWDNNTVEMNGMIPTSVGAWRPVSYSGPTNAVYGASATTTFSQWTTVGKFAGNSTAPADTAENILTSGTVTIPAGMIGPYGAIKVWTLWNCSGAGTKTARVRMSGIGGTDFLNQVVSAAGVSTCSTTIMNRNSASSQIASTEFLGVPVAATISGAVNTAVSTTIVITGQKSVGGDTMDLLAYHIEIVAG